MSRFSDQEHLEVWRRNGTYPAIHQPMLMAIMNWARGTYALDLGCHFGLLAQRLTELGVTTVGCDADAGAIELGRSYGVTADLVQLRVAADTLPDLAELIRSHMLTVLVARRCLPEILGPFDFDYEFVDAIADAGVTEVFVEGRIETRGAVNRLSSLRREISVLQRRYVIGAAAGRVAYLRRIPR